MNVQSPKNPNLEALRGILAIMVLISHIQLIRMYFGRSYEYMNPIIFHLGRVAVTGFFVLSGFLITSSILKRRENINWTLKNFYFGRIFRIWPLYYFVILLAIYVIPNIKELNFIIDPIYDARLNTDNYKFFYLFMPQVPLINNFVLPFAEPTWSIGVEEIFYLVIPFIIIYSKKNFIKCLLIFIIFFIILKYIFIYYYQFEYSDFPAKLINYYRYDCIALGCLIGALYHQKSTIFQAIKGFHLVVALILFVVLFHNITVNSYDYFPFAICFAIIIAYLVNKKEVFKSPKWLIFIGTISYSLYLTHEIAIVYLLNLRVDEKSMSLMVISAIALAILIASIVYYLIEKPFMNLWKNKLEI